jgi:predicted DNA-binding mobile mystery protein A
MSRVQLASRLGVRPQTVETFEKSEATGSIQLGTLRRVAEALDCTVVYAFVPKTSLEDAVMQRARTIAIRDLRRAAHSMKLEAQGTPDAGMEARLQNYIRDAIKESDLWNEP